MGDALDIPLGVMLYVRACVRVEVRPYFHDFCDTDMVVTLVTLDQDDSFRCTVWAIQYPCIETIMSNRWFMLPYTAIIHWSVWENKHAPLTVNFAYFTPTYRTIAFSL